MARARVEHDNRSVMVYQWPERLRSLTIFIGELYVQMLISNANRLDVLRTGFSDLMDTLTSTDGKDDPSFVPIIVDNVKSAILALKCCGKCLEADEEGLAGQKFSAIQNACNAIQAPQDLRKSVDLLRERLSKGWVVETMRNGPEPSKKTHAESGGAPLYIGPDGNPLSKEELDFLDENLSRQDSSLDDVIGAEEDQEFQDFVLQHTANESSR